MLASNLPKSIMSFQEPQKVTLAMVQKMQPIVNVARVALKAFKKGDRGLPLHFQPKVFLLKVSTVPPSS